MAKENEIIFKTKEEQIAELERALRLLENSLAKINQGSEDETLIIWGLLRLLVCDPDRRAEGGLLCRLIKLTGYTQMMRLDNAEAPLQAWKRQRSFISSTGSSENVDYSVTRCDIINNLAQNEGLAHSSPKRHVRHADFMTVLAIGKSEKANLAIGTALQWGGDVLRYGRDFLASMSA
jgi:hypothetical protein